MQEVSELWLCFELLAQVLQPQGFPRQQNNHQLASDTFFNPKSYCYSHFFPTSQGSLENTGPSGEG